MRIFRWVSLFLGLALAPATLASSNQTTFINLSPPSQWHLTKTETLDLNQISKWGGIPPVDAEYGVKTVELRTYARTGVKIQALVEAAADPPAAFGLLTFYDTANMQAVHGVPLAFSGPDSAVMARKNLFLRVLSQSAQKVSQDEVRSFLLTVGGSELAPHSQDLLPAPLPSKGMVPGSEKFLLGPEAASRVLPQFPIKLLGFGQSAEVHVASYARGGGQIMLMLIAYPTPQIARQRFSAAESFLDVNHDRGSGSWIGKRDSSYVFLVQRTGPATLAQATFLMNALTVEKSVTVDQKYPKPYAVQVLTFIYANILLILILIGMAFTGGILIVISRRLLARFFPHSEWVGAGENSFIQLHLEGR